MDSHATSIFKDKDVPKNHSNVKYVPKYTN